MENGASVNVGVTSLLDANSACWTRVPNTQSKIPRCKEIEWYWEQLDFRFPWLWDENVIIKRISCVGNRLRGPGICDRKVIAEATS